MQFQEKEILLKDGKTAVLRSPVPDDAEQLLQYLVKTASETHFLLRTPEEWTMTIEQEIKFLQNLCDTDDNIMILCTVEGKIAGTCQLNRKTKIRNRHRGSIGIALLQDYWHLGIGTAMFAELIAVGKQWGLTQLELEFIEGNHRAQGLYEKMGFEVVAAIPNAIRLKDGTMLKEFTMVKPL